MEGVSASGATARAEINPNGPVTTYRFEYVTEAAYLDKGFANAVKVPSSGMAPLGKGMATLLANATLGPLVPTTAYRYRAVATNEDGTTPGPERSLTTKGFGTPFRLPDNRGWEMVSPVDKGGGAIAAPGALFGGGDIQAAVGGGMVTYGSGTAFGNAVGAPPVSQYVSRRTALGWVTENVSTPLESAAYGDEPDGAPYRVFSADLSRALLFGGLACRGGLAGCPAPNPPLPGSGAPEGWMAYYLRASASGALSSLLGPADVALSGVSPQSFEAAFAAASSDLSSVLLSSCAKLTGDAIEVPAGPGQCDPAAQNLYAWSTGGLKAVNLLPGQVASTPGAAVAAPSGAVATDGSRIYWTRGGDLYLREGAQTHQVDEGQGGGGAFQTATPDGAIAFFTKAGHLYRFATATKVAVDITPSGGVMGVLGASADGDYVYYQDGAGLQLWHGGAIATIAPGADATVPSSYPPATGTARVNPAGTHLAFLSKADLTGYDNADATTQQPVTELYLYNLALTGGSPLICVSCNPSGERPQGPSTIPGALVNGTTLAYKPRALSAAGTRLFFDSEDSLVSHDTSKANGVADPHSLPDVYQWEAFGVGDCQRAPGCVSLISNGAGQGTTFLDASGDGSDVFFITNDSLVDADPGSIDVYDARVGGGFPAAGKPIVCTGDACQPLPGEPDDPTPGTLTPSSGNPPLQIFEPKSQKHKKKRHRKKRHRKKHGKIASSREWRGR